VGSYGVKLAAAHRRVSGTSSVPEILRTANKASSSSGSREVSVTAIAPPSERWVYESLDMGEECTWTDKQRRRYNIHIPRQTLREILLTTLTHPEHVEWGKQLVGMKDEDECVHVTFADGTETRCSVIVGADGIYSNVRRYLLSLSSDTSCCDSFQSINSIQFHYLGLVVILGISPLHLHCTHTSLHMDGEPISGRHQVQVTDF
jgi:2-polyprenyl-6-methoxyphenol hydroxylase-like FAD-dependent oxidoreductase